MTLREQFEKETGIVIWVTVDGAKLFTEDYVEWLEQRQETASAVDTIVSVPELLSLAEVVREQPKVDRLLGDNGVFAKVREQVYNECAGFIEQLAKGDRSVIEKM